MREDDDREVSNHEDAPSRQGNSSFFFMIAHPSIYPSKVTSDQLKEEEEEEKNVWFYDISLRYLLNLSLCRFFSVSRFFFSFL